MPPKYRPIDADDHAVQIFELEAAHVQGDDRKPHRRTTRRAFVFFVTCLLSLLLVLVGYTAYKYKRGGQERVSLLRGNPKAESSMHEPHSIFCYGDSLTFGMSAMSGSSERYPYAKFLQEELKHLVKSTDESKSQPEEPTAQVQYLGLPGWTASSVLNHVHDNDVGICNIIENTPALALMIILVGTNDIGQMTNSDKSAARSIIGSIVDLHKQALQCAAREESRVSFHTLAVGIPGSAFQEMVPVASELASYVNSALEAFAASNTQVTYVDFPIPYRDGDERWASDGLHLTQAGYKVLAKELAPRAKTILDNME